MAVPRNRMSNARKNSRRAHHALKAKHTRTCSTCGYTALNHHACSICGIYRGRSVRKG